MTDTPDRFACRSENNGFSFPGERRLLPSDRMRPDSLSYL